MNSCIRGRSRGIAVLQPQLAWMPHDTDLKILQVASWKHGPLKDHHQSMSNSIWGQCKMTLCCVSICNRLVGDACNEDLSIAWKLTMCLIMFNLQFLFLSSVQRETAKMTQTSPSNFPLKHRWSLADCCRDLEGAFVDRSSRRAIRE